MTDESFGGTHNMRSNVFFLHVKISDDNFKTRCVMTLSLVLEFSNNIPLSASFLSPSLVNFSSEKEQLAEEDEDDLKEVLDLRKIAVQLLQQEQQNR